MDRLGDASQGRVSHLMTQLIINTFEMIDIGQQYRKGIAVPMSPGKFAVKFLADLAPVGNAGERIDPREVS